MPEVLVVEDDSAMLALVVEELTERGFDVVGVAGAAEAMARLEAAAVDVLVTDLNLARSSGLGLCRDALALDPELSVIIITAFGSLTTAVGAIRAGAYDFLTKPLSMDALAMAIERAAKLRALKREVSALRVRVLRQKHLSKLDGTSLEITRLRERLATVATADITVLLLGESGSGKGLAATEIHNMSRRSAGPFIAENLAAIPGALLESTLFGHVRGAFTGATGPRTGLFRQAHGGTLLLDEIGELPLALQAKLLRVIEEGKVRPVGGDQELPVDVRLLAATNRELDDAVRSGDFREDLYYRLAVIELPIPPLRARGSDILLLAQKFIEQQARKTGRSVQGLHHETAALLLAWDWPGNVRELRNVMDRAVVLCGQRLIMPSDLPDKLRQLSPVLAAPMPRDAPLLPLEEVERRHILHVLSAVAGNKAEAARLLGIGRKTLYRKLEAWGVTLGHGDTL